MRYKEGLRGAGRPLGGWGVKNRGGGGVGVGMGVGWYRLQGGEGGHGAVLCGHIPAYFTGFSG